MTHTDINSKGWIAHLPAPIQPYVLLMRLDRPIGTWLLLLPGWWAVMLARGGAGGLGREGVWLMVLFGLGALIMRGAGCVINDLWDRNLDRRVERTRTRPLASGRLGIAHALAFLLALLCLGLVILLQMDPVAVLLGCLSLVLVVVYPSMKRITWWPQAFLGLTFNAGALIGWAAATGIGDSAGALGLPALLLYCAGFFWTLGYDTIYAHQDIEDDIRIGIKSTARRLRGRSKIWVTRFYAVCWGFLFLAFAAAQAGPVSFVLLVAAGAHLWWQIWQWRPIHPLNCLRLFRSNRDFGLLVLLALAFSGIHF